MKTNNCKNKKLRFLRLQFSIQILTNSSVRIFLHLVVGDYILVGKPECQRYLISLHFNK